MLSAVAYCHYNLIAHRDIKPENFLFSNPDPRAPLKLIDFGLSKQFVKHVPMHSMVGTLNYSAPEVLMGKGYNEKCDVWSLGVVAFLCTTGFLPIYYSDEAKL